MDIQHLVDRLEDLIDEGRHLFGTKYTMLDEERALEIIDQMRISIPDEIERAARTIQQRDRVLAEANEEAARIVQQARQHSEDLIDEQEMVKQAKFRAEYIIEGAELEADEISQDADSYALERLSLLERQFTHMLGEVREGIQLLQDQESGQDDPPTPEPQISQAPQQVVRQQTINFERPAPAPRTNS